MRASLRGRKELAARVQEALALTTKKEGEMVVGVVVGALEIRWFARIPGILPWATRPCPSFPPARRCGQRQPIVHLVSPRLP